MAEAALLPTRTLECLQGVKRRLRKAFVLSGLMSLGFGACGGIAFSFVVDYTLVLPVGVRFLFLAGGASALAYHSRRSVVAWLARRISDEDVANLVERCQPGLRQSLITAVELTRPGSETAAYVSRSLIESVVASVESQIGKIDFARILSLRLLHGKMALFGLSSIVLLLAGSVDPALAGIWFRRNILLSSEGWPRHTDLELLAPGLPAVVAVGDSLEVAIRATRGKPKAVELWHAERDRTERVEVLAETTSGTFRKLFENVARPFRFRARGGDAEIGPFEVDVKLRPRIDMQSIEVWCEYPAYTGLPPTAASEPLRHGNIKVPAGTRVRYRMAANVAVRRVFFVLKAQGGAEAKATGARSDSGEPSQPPAGAVGASPPREEAGPGDPGGGTLWPAPGAVELGIRDGRRFAGDFVVAESGYYYFQLESEDSFRSGRPDRFRVEAIPDRKPIVKIVSPEQVTEPVSPEASVKIRVSASDDYGLEKGSVNGFFFAGPDREGDVRVFELSGLKDAASTEGKLRGEGESREVEITLDVAELAPAGKGPPAPGSSFKYMALVSDSAGNAGESQKQSLEIVDKGDLLRILGDLLIVVRDQLREILRRQASARKDVADLEGQLTAAGKIGGEDSQKVFRHQQDQLRISQALEREAASLQRIVERSIQNKVGDDKWRNWVGGVKSDLSQLALGKSRDAERILEAIRRDCLSKAQDPGRLSLVQAAQREVEREIDSIILRLSEFGDMNALIQMLREVRRRQADLREETRSRATVAPPEESKR